ncbi:SGNH/GDSL hydrolase family protein [Streptomyces sp. AC495_CC817]|uniref:SGNH/GDSL hydrolase family protein n=1 Tax=Streptomyces sp. AC495_CC817 TaxID=2823900 RepID=UPI001C27870D|nr:SGNH/GDSL hydrolase family protein [Streptomyces sp. AC495_CC817]
MTELFRWAGYGDADTPFDHEATAFNPLFVYGIDDGEPCLVYSPTGSQTFIGKSPLGSPASLSVRMVLKLSGYPSSSVPIIAPLTSGGTSAWRIRLSSTGTLIIDNPSNTATGTTSAIPLNTRVLVQILATASTVKVRIYNAARGGTLIGAETTGTSTFGLVDNWRQGQAASSPIVPTYRISHLLVTDDTTWLPDPDVPDAPTTPRYGIIGDSLTAMSGANGEYIRQALLTAGIPPQNVYLWGVGGKRIAVADLTGKTSAQNIQDAKNVLTTIDHWVVALGTNDRPQTDATVNAAIDTILLSIGGTAKVTWIGLTSKGAASADDIRVNGMIQAKLTARGNAVFADWDAHIRAIDGGANPSPYWVTTDSTHMTATGYTERARFYVTQMQDAPHAATGTGALTLSPAAASGTGTSVVPTFTGTAILALPGVLSTGLGAATVPTYNGAGDAAVSSLQAVGLGANVPPVFVGTADALLAGFTASGAGTTDDPSVSTGPGTLVVPTLTGTGIGATEPPGWAGDVALSLPCPLVAATGTTDEGTPPSSVEFRITTHVLSTSRVRPRPLSPPVWPPR